MGCSNSTKSIEVVQPLSAMQKSEDPEYVLSWPTAQDRPKESALKSKQQAIKPQASTPILEPTGSKLIRASAAA